MEPIVVLISTIAGVVALAWLLQGIRLYRACKGDIYKDIYGSFPAYFYRYVVLRNCSESGYLRARIGRHRIVYSSITKPESGKTNFCVIFHQRGIMVLCYDRAAGQYLGSPNQKNWNVIRFDKQGKQHNFRHPNPTADMKAYTARLAGFFPEVHLESRLAFHNEADLSKLRTDFKAIHFRDIPQELAAAQGEFVTEEQIEAMHSRLVNG